jgi:hypothetical protein
MSGIQVLDRVPSVTKLTKFEGATPDMDKDRINWPVVVLVLGIAGMTLGAIVALSLSGKSTEAVVTTILGLLAAFGFYQHSSTQKDLGKIQEQGATSIAQTNGRMTQMQNQQNELIKMVRDLALRVPPPMQQQGTDGSHTHPEPDHDPNV